MGVSLITIQQGDPITAEAELFFLGTGSAGDPTSPRVLTWPASETPLLAPIVYSIDSTAITLNPSRTFNLDNEVLPHPRASAVETLGTTLAVRFERAVADVVVTELWEAPSGASMPTSFFRLLYEYLRNAALLPPGGPYIQWEPRDRNEKVYDVVLLSLSVGSGDDELRFDIADVRADPRTPVKQFDDPLRSLSPTPTGLLTAEVRLRFLIVGEAA